MDNHKAKISYKTLKSNLVNLPSNLTNLLFTANIQVQDVIIEIVNQNKKCYAGWSGMSSSNLQYLEIDPIFAQSINLSDSTSIIVNLKLHNYESTNIQLEPLTSSDWELVELHAQSIEDKLLSQTRCVALNQILVVYPSSTTSAKLLVTDLGTTDHLYGKISPYCEIAIAPKLRKETSSSKKDSSSVISNTIKEDYSNSFSILKRGISLPHKKFEFNNDQYEVYMSIDELPIDFKNSDYYAAVSIVPGPNDKPSKVVDEEQQAKLKENKKIIAKIVDYKTVDNIGISSRLAIALGIENQIGNIIVLKPAIKNLSKRPTTLTIYPYITQTKKSKEINTTKNNKLLQQLTTELYPHLSELIITNNLKLPIIPNILPNGGLLKFRKNDDVNAWIKPYSLNKKKPIKLELGDDILKPTSYIEQKEREIATNENAIGLDSLVDEIIESFTTTENTGSLIYGNSGSGKTLLIKLISEKLYQDYGYYIKFISCENLMNENFQNLSKNHIIKWLQQCQWNKPSILVLDNVDKLMSNERENRDSSKSNQITEFFISQLEKIYNQKNSNLSILLTSISKESINKLLLSSHLIENFFKLESPNKNLRFEILQSYLVEQLGLKLNKKIDLMDLVSETEGYLPNDLKILCDRIYHDYLFNDNLELTTTNFENGLKNFTPSNLLNVKLQKSTINWSDIGGLKQAKDIFFETLEWPTKYAPIFANCPLRLRSGILLYGYPGCGKTLLASAISGQCGLNFISIKGPEILNKYIGASEQSVRELFERAQAAKPCILFFDEFDSIAPKRGHDSTGVTDRVVNQLLTQMDGAEGLDGVYVLAATSRPDLIDSALLRPGRLDKSVICDMPNYEDRLDILKSITSKMDLSNDVNLEEIAKKTHGFSGADMQGLAYNAYLKAVHVTLEELENSKKEETNNDSVNDSIEFFKVSNDSKKMKPVERIQLLNQIKQFLQNENKNNEDIKKQQDSISKSKVLINCKNFVESLKETKPSISKSEMTKLQKIYKQFINERDGNMPSGTPSNEIGGRTTLM
ncbi:unnamed protein product [Candida verbasci]|uniref:Peroxisomal ATPase PEX1 n=1 Tax=Candida verbasci TaxID=1227364 RepID=A0A9W4XNE2_9ASCO|nr:unnamed protein product [Candida verbasci]